MYFRSECLEFWYHSNGARTGSLSLYVEHRLNATSSVRELLYSVSGDHGDEWHVAQLNVPIRAKVEYRVAFEAAFDGGAHERGLIALDDLDTKDYKCQQPMGNCNFEDDMCAWKNAASGARLDWVRHKGITANNDTGPSVDHTNGAETGGYLLFPTSERTTPGENARLVSPVFHGGYAACFDFWYHMRGRFNSTLLVAKKKRFHSSSDSVGRVLWRDDRDHGDVWVQALVAVEDVYDDDDGAEASDDSSNYVLIVEAIASSAGKGDIALDDIQITPRKYCPSSASSSSTSLPTTTTTTTTSTTLSTTSTSSSSTSAKLTSSQSKSSLSPVSTSSRALKTSSAPAEIRCPADYCHNGGTCLIVYATMESQPTLQCECVEKYTGRNCENQLFDMSEEGTHTSIEQ